MSDLFNKVTTATQQSILVKLVVIGVLALLLLIPTAMVSDLVNERESTKQEAVDDICSKWGGSQTISGPVISIPYIVTAKNPRTGEQTTNHNTVHLLPEELKIDGESITETRYRGIYKAILYNTQLSITGYFDLDSLHTLSNIQLEHLDFANAVISMGISDMKGIRQKVQGNIGNEAINLGPGLPSKDIFQSGIQSKLPL